MKTTNQTPVFSFHLAPAEGPEGEVKEVTGTAAELAPVIQAYLSAHRSGACLQWQIGAGWEECFLHPADSLAVNLERAWEELVGIYGPPPAFNSAEAEAAALVIVPALLTAARDMERPDA